jgi:hypothetical protein
MGFKESVAADIKGVFLNIGEFGDTRTVIYDGAVYADIPVVLTRLRETERVAKLSVSGKFDSSQGLYMADAVMHCAVEDVGGALPERGQRIRISEADGFLKTYYVSSSHLDMGMVRAELSIIDE